MDLKSRMSLDIGNVTKNLSKVASQTAALAKRMSASFKSAQKDIKDFSNTLQTDSKLEGKSVFETLAVQASTMGTNIAGVFKRIPQHISNALGTMRSTVNRGITEIEARFDSLGLFNTVGAGIKTVANSVANSFIRMGSAISNIAHGALPAFRAALNNAKSNLINLATNAVRPFVHDIDKANERLKEFIKTLSAKIYTGNRAIKELEESTKKAGVQFKDVARIVQGIMISKLFYTSLNAIRSATSAVWEFTKALEFSRLVYVNFLGSLEESKNFTNILQDFAAKTRFSFAELNTSAQQLLAYGFQAKNLMYVLRGVSAAASISGDPQKIESISRALGQINTKGRLMAEEMRQLAEAGIPAYTILQEKLGLTYEQLQKLGDLNIPADTAINALIDGITERFGGLLEYSNQTMMGIASNIGDVWLQLASNVFAPVSAKIKNIMSDVLGQLNNLLATFKQSGIGGVFETLVPKDLQPVIRSLISTFIEFFSVLGQLGKNLFAVIGNALPTLISWLNIFLTEITFVLRIVADITSVIVGNKVALEFLTKALLIAAAAWLAFKIQTIAAAVSAGMIKILQGISKALTILSGTLTKLAQHPFILFAVVLTGILLALTGSFDTVRNAVNNFLNSFNRVKSNSILQPTKMDKSSTSVDKYSDKLGDMSDALETVAGSAKKASKALLSFDEVYSLPDESGLPGDDLIEQVGNFFPSLDDFNPDDLLNVDVSGFGKDLADDMLGAFGDNFANFGTSIADKLKAMDIGDMIIAGVAAALAIFTLGATPVGLFAAIAAVFVTAFYDDLAKAFEDATGQEGSFDVLISDAVVALLLSALTKAGASTGLEAGIAGLAIVIVQQLLTQIGNAFGKSEEATSEASVMAAATGILGFLIAAVSGVATLPLTALYAAVGGLAYLFRDQFLKVLDDPTFQAVFIEGLAIAIGACFGSVPGAIVGALIGAAYLIVAYFWDDIAAVWGQGWDSFVKDIKEWWTSVGNYFNFKNDETLWQIGNDIISGIFAGIGAAIATIADFVYKVIFAPLYDCIKQTFGINSPAETMKPIGENIILGILSGISNSVGTLLKGITDLAPRVISAFASWVPGVNGLFNTDFKPAGGTRAGTAGRLGSSIDTNVGAGSSRLVTNTKLKRKIAGHALGGIFNREHIARFAENNKSEMAIPLENNSAMQPFVNAISNSLYASLAPMFANRGSGNELRPLYVGTLIADERGLRELNRKMQVMQLNESSRRGR